MEKRHNYAAAGFLLLGIGAAGRAFLGVPEGVTMAELSLTVLLVIGALLLTRQGLAALVCGLAATALELVLCGSWVQAGAALAAAAPFFRRDVENAACVLCGKDFYAQLPLGRSAVFKLGAGFFYHFREKNVGKDIFPKILVPQSQPLKLAAADGNFSGRLRGLHLPNSLSEKAGTPLAVFLPCAVWRVLKKNMRKHPRQVNREALC